MLILELDLDLLSLTAGPAEAGGARSAASLEKLVAGGLGGPGAGEMVVVGQGKAAWSTNSGAIWSLPYPHGASP